jgi:hypothetical protein
MDWLNWLGQIGAWVSTWIWRVLRILWVCRVAAVSAIGGGLLIAGAEQARDLFADTGLSTGSWTLFFFLLFLWAWLVHGMGRRALQFDEWVPEAHRPGGLQDDDRVRLRKEFYWYAIVIPRLLGLVVFIATALALWSTHENLAGATALKQATAARSLTWTLLKWTVAIGAGYLVFISLWRSLRAYFSGHDKDEPLLIRAESVLRLACLACANWKKNSPALRKIVESTLNKTLISAAVIVTAVFVIALIWPAAVSDRFPRAIFVPLLLGGGVLLFGEIASLSHRYMLPLLIAFFILGGLLSLRLVHYDDVRWVGPGKSTGIEGAAHQWDLSEAIARWRADNDCSAPKDGASKECPRPIVIAGAGGASRAGFFTASVVGAMIDAGAKDKDLGNIRKRIFALSTVSGSSAGAVMMRAAWMDALANKTPDQPPCTADTEAWFRGGAQPSSGEDSEASPWRDCFQKLMAGDFLSPVFVGLTYRDMFPLGNPFNEEALGENRSGLLEQSFERWYRQITGGERASCSRDDNTGLCRRLGHLPDRADPNHAGDWIPLLFINGTSVESGRRIIVSDVRIGCILPKKNAQEKDRRFLEFAYDYREMRDPAVRTNEQCSPELNDPPGEDIDMRLSTVALMSARFPVISTQGVIRDVKGKIVDSVVDGGYFENEGLATAADIVRELQSDGLHPVVIRIMNEPDPKIDLESDQKAGDAGKTDDTARAKAEARSLSSRVIRDGETELARPPLPKAEERTFFDVYTSIGRALYATSSGHEDGHLAYLRETLKGPLVRIGVDGIDPPQPTSSASRAALAAFCRSPVTQRTAMTFVSMSWWMSQSVQAYLDAQLCRPQMVRLLCVLKLKAGESDEPCSNTSTALTSR